MSDFRDLDQLLQKYVDDGLPGCGCVIAKQGKILYENYFGWSDKEQGKPLTRENVFRQASLTKIAMYHGHDALRAGKVPDDGSHL